MSVCRQCGKPQLTARWDDSGVPQHVTTCILPRDITHNPSGGGIQMVET